MCHPSWGRALAEAAQRQSDLARLRRVRDRIDREYAQPLNVEALARGEYMSAGHLSRQFQVAYGEWPYAYRPGCGRDAAVCGETGQPTGQESRGRIAAVRALTRRPGPPLGGQVAAGG